MRLSGGVRAVPGPPQTARAPAHARGRDPKRRHLGEAERALVAAKVAQLGVGRPGKETASPDAVSQGQAADLVGVSRASVQRAKVVLEEGTPEEQQAVAGGTAGTHATA